MTSPLTYDAVISAPSALPTDMTTARYDAEAHEIVVTFRDDKIACVPTREFEELATATAADYTFLDGTRAGVTCLTETIDFAVAADWWRSQAE
jgi:hypothetical protein